MLKRNIIILQTLVFLSAQFLFAVGSTVEKSLTIDSIKFLAPVNVKAFSIKGEAKSIDGKLTLFQQSVQSLRFSIPVDSLTTNMSLRDKHMRDRIFKAQDGTTPPIEFESLPSQPCSVVGDDLECKLKGNLKIHGSNSEVSFPVKLLAYKANESTAEGETKIKLSQFGITPPEHMGMKVEDEISIQFRVKAK